MPDIRWIVDRLGFRTEEAVEQLVLTARLCLCPLTKPRVVRLCVGVIFLFLLLVLLCLLLLLLDHLLSFVARLFLLLCLLLLLARETGSTTTTTDILFVALQCCFFVVGISTIGTLRPWRGRG